MFFQYQSGRSKAFIIRTAAPISDIPFGQEDGHMGLDARGLFFGDPVGFPV